ncbi:hypothetical protein J6E39_00035 [bacterium]|nr:hypothetical protein [bacterium]
MRELDEFIAELKQSFGERLLSVVVFGSNANREKDLVKSNVDLMLIFDKFSGEDLQRISPLAKKWIKAKNPYPIMMGLEEFYSSKDVYALEYSDIKWNYEIIYGQDYITNLPIMAGDLRFQAEREVKALLMKLRGFYLQYGNNSKSLREALLRTIKSVLVVFRAILRLRGVQPSVYKKDLIYQISEVFNIDVDIYQILLAEKEKRTHIKSCDLRKIYLKTVNHLASLLLVIDKM